MRGEVGSKLPPYGEIVEPLVAATMRAQLELIRSCKSVAEVAAYDDAQINRHFAWLTWVYEEGENRHLYEGDDVSSLLTLGLRAKSQVEEHFPTIAALLRAKHSLPLVPEDTFDGAQCEHIRERFVQGAPTRISNLLKQSYQISLRAKERRRSSPQAILVSPLAIVYDFLTIPDMPGSRAYALLTLRNFLFEKFETKPEGHGEVSEEKLRSFSVRDLEEARSRVWTSLRPRFNSRGQDKFSIEGKLPVDGVLRHFLAMRRVLWLWFEDQASCEDFCRRQDIRGGSHTEVGRSNDLAELPELGEIVNELWGIPIPIRGADTIFRGGLKFSSRQGLVMAVHGGPGTGKTSLALALGAYLAPMNIRTLFLSGEEQPTDLLVRLEGLVPAGFKRVSFFPQNFTDWLAIESYELGGQPDDDILDALDGSFDELAQDLSRSSGIASGAPQPCRAVVVLDGLHQLFRGRSATDGIERLHAFISRCRKLRALVVLTTSAEWAADAKLDYLVDVSLDLSVKNNENETAKPERIVRLIKARHQLSAIGAHGINIAGEKGLRFSPQVSYHLDQRSIWRTSLPQTGSVKTILRHTLPIANELGIESRRKRWWAPSQSAFYANENSVYLYRASNIFITGRGSGGKASLALKIAIAPSFAASRVPESRWRLEQITEKILVISFLYPAEYYIELKNQLTRLRLFEYGLRRNALPPRMNVIHLYPGNYNPRDLFNRIEWELEAAELEGDPYTCAVIDGLHNVSVQFPEIEKHGLFWPQLYSAMRSRSMTTITTYTALVVPHAAGEETMLDDKRSEPLRHALVQKMDFHIEVDPLDQLQLREELKEVEEVRTFDSNFFKVKVLSAIRQPIPESGVYWSRESLMVSGAAPRIDGVERSSQYALPLSP